MAGLVRRLLALSDPSGATFASLVASKRHQAAAELAEARVDAGKRKAFYFRKLIELRSQMGDHDGVLKLFEKHGFASRAMYPLLLIRATALIETGRLDEARRAVLDLIAEHHFLAPMRLYRRLPVTPDSIDLAVAAFARSARPMEIRMSQATSLVDIAAAAGDFDRAGEMLSDLLRDVAGAEFPAAPKQKPPLDPTTGAAALVDLHDLLIPETPFFLISGTLLGVIREGRLIGGDKDIDVGVFGADAFGKIRAAIAGGDLFTESFTPSDDLIRVNHRNGANIDLFLHHVENGKVWHGSHLHAWDNQIWWREGEDPLAEIDFAGRCFLIPSDPDLYLTDNYGDWRTPVGDYDAALEAPNRRIRDRALVRVHWRKRVIRYYMDGEWVLLSKSFHHYAREFGVDPFLREASRLLLMRDMPDEVTADVIADDVQPLTARR